MQNKTEVDFEKGALPGNFAADDILVHSYEYTAKHVHSIWPLRDHANEVVEEGGPLLWILNLPQVIFENSEQ